MGRNNIYNMDTKIKKMAFVIHEETKSIINKLNYDISKSSTQQPFFLPQLLSFVKIVPYEYRTGAEFKEFIINYASMSSFGYECLGGVVSCRFESREFNIYTTKEEKFNEITGTYYTVIWTHFTVGLYAILQYNNEEKTEEIFTSEFSYSSEGEGVHPQSILEIMNAKTKFFLGVETTFNIVYDKENKKSIFSISYADVVYPSDFFIKDGGTIDCTLDIKPLYFEGFSDSPWSNVLANTSQQPAMYFNSCTYNLNKT